ncbi:hypothetical protein KAU45_11265 [bacterium]|nr:hypothetical protein [bacterium]
MRKFLLLALVAAIGLFFTGCGKELNDDNFVDYWVDIFNVESVEDAEKIADDYGWSGEDLDKYFDELMEDEERADAVIEAIEEKDEDAAFALEMTLFPERAFADFGDLMDDFDLELEEDLEELSEELEGAVGELEEALEDLEPVTEETTE